MGMFLRVVELSRKVRSDGPDLAGGSRGIAVRVTWRPRLRKASNQRGANRHGTTLPAARRCCGVFAVDGIQASLCRFHRDEGGNDLRLRGSAVTCGAQEVRSDVHYGGATGRGTWVAKNTRFVPLAPILRGWPPARWNHSCSSVDMLHLTRGPDGRSGRGASAAPFS